MTFICELHSYSLDICENELSASSFRKLSYYILQMCAFSYVWSLPVMLQRWRSHHCMRHTRKLHATHKPPGSIFYRTAVMGNRSLHVAGIRVGILDLFATVTLTITRRWRSDGRNQSGTVELGRACSCIS